uniref:Uncharacterized protein n=1 Tax=Oryza punctata TaxID=4537 RepID=A0A0E0KGL9_ORYPU
MLVTDSVLLHTHSQSAIEQRVRRAVQSMPPPPRTIDLARRWSSLERRHPPPEALERAPPLEFLAPLSPRQSTGL